MQDKTTPSDGEASKQILSDVPGPAVIIPEGIYKIYTLLNNSSVVDMHLGGAPNAVQIFHDNNEPESRWHIRYDDRVNAHRIKNDYPGNKYLYVINYSEVYVSQPPNDLAPQYNWTFKNEGIGTDVFYIESAYTLHVLDVEGSGTSDRTKINDLPYKGSVNQKFKLVRL